MGGLNRRALTFKTREIRTLVFQRLQDSFHLSQHWRTTLHFKTGWIRLCRVVRFELKINFSRHRENKSKGPDHDPCPKNIRAIVHFWHPCIPCSKCRLRVLAQQLSDLTARCQNRCQATLKNLIKAFHSLMDGQRSNTRYNNHIDSNTPAHWRLEAQSSSAWAPRDGARHVCLETASWSDRVRLIGCGRRGHSLPLSFVHLFYRSILKHQT